MRGRRFRSAAFICTASIVATVAFAQNTATPGHWVSAWSTAVHTPRSFPGMPPPLSIQNQTLREIVRPTIGGEHLRVRISNESGAEPLTLDSVHIALADADSGIVSGSDRVLTFGGKGTVQIPAGAPMLSDPVELRIPAFADVAVSIYVSKKTTPSSFHLLGQRATYISGPGNFADALKISDAKETPSWYWLSDLEFWAPEQTHVLVTLGDSITDGFGAMQGAYEDWPDVLADRLALGKGSPVLAVDNEGIGGNRILYDGAGVSALARFDRDVLARPGVTEVILLEGINDIGWPNMELPRMKDGVQQKNPFADQVVTASDLILGMQQIIARAHQHGIKVFGATMTPYKGANYFSDAGEKVREAVNDWIRTSGAFDGVFDFDAAVRDPSHPQQFRDDYQSGDHLHPNAAGYKAMAASIDLDRLRACANKTCPTVESAK